MHGTLPQGAEVALAPRSFTFTAVLLFGPEAGAVTLALDSLVLAWHRRMPLDKAAFNFGNLTLAVWIREA